MNLRWLSSLPVFVAAAACALGDGTTSAQDGAATETDGRNRFPAADRVVAIGDVHGDLDATRRALRLAEVIDDEDRWIGGTSVVVQTGDVLDRGDDEQAILDLLLALEPQAEAAGGKLHLLNGNHELLNVVGAFNYVTPGGFEDFFDVEGLNLDDPRLERYPEEQRPRAAAFLPGGLYAKKIAPHPVAIIVGDTVFAHGGVLPHYAEEGLDTINGDVSAFIDHGDSAGFRIVQDQEESPVWSRHFSEEPEAGDCALLDESLEILGASRMVVGHTVQPHISSACDDKVWRVDVGMSAHYGGPVEVLEITADGLRAIAEPTPDLPGDEESE